MAWRWGYRILLDSEFRADKIAGPKSPGLVVLEHEDSDGALNAFMDAFPKIITNGWKFDSLAHLLGNGQAYQNSNDANSEVKPVNLMTGLTNTTIMSKNASTTAPAPSSSSESVLIYYSQLHQLILP